MDITATANALLPLLGGKENIASAAHCATRLRPYWWTTAKWIRGHRQTGWRQGCFSNAGQIQ